MSIEGAHSKSVESVVRALATASKSLRLYPPSSPIPAQSIAQATSALDELFRTGIPVLSLAVTREGFSAAGEMLSHSVAGVDELTEALRKHGVAELSITQDCSGDELLRFLGVIETDPEEIRNSGGISAALLAAGVECMRVTDVHLTVVEQVGPKDDQDIEDFLRELASDPEKLSAWFAAASSGDPRAFEESLMELVRVSGPSGYGDMISALSEAFVAQHPEAKDALLGLALDRGPTRDLTASMFEKLSSGDIAGSIIGGSFGKNMLSLSTALTRLPLESVTAQVRAEVQAMLPTSGHSSKESDFLNHMIDVRQRQEPEPVLGDTGSVHLQAANYARIDANTLDGARSAIAQATGQVSATAVRTILQLLDQQKDFELYCSSVDSLSMMVPRLLEQRDLDMAEKVIAELVRRETLNVAAWPDLSARMRRAIDVATGPRAMASLVKAVVEEPGRMVAAQRIVRQAGEAGHAALVNEAVALKGAGIEVAEQLVGRRIVDLLWAAAQHAQWFQLAPIATRLAREADPRSVQTLESLMSRPDEQSRREVVNGVAMSPSPVSDRILARALRDSSAEVAITAARAIGKGRAPGAAALVGARLAELDLDNAGFVLGRELIATLARLSEPAAGEILDKLASRRAIIKRGHFQEVADLVAQARKYRSEQGGGS